MTTRHIAGIIALCFMYFFIIHCESPSETDDGQGKEVFWPELVFEPLFCPFNVCYIYVFDSLYGGYVGDDSTDVVNLYSSLGDHETVLVYYDRWNWFAGILTQQTQTYLKMDNVFQLPPNDREGWVVAAYYSKYSKQSYVWRYTLEIEENNCSE